MGRSGGITAGRDGNVHFGDRELGCVGMVSMLPDMMLVATGMAMAFKLRGRAPRGADVVRRRLDRRAATGTRP
jgi:pyruvate dehydrogenase E1 component alpha subunit